MLPAGKLEVSVEKTSLIHVLERDCRRRLS